MILLNSDAHHIPLADQAVQCIITSPPYFGLRDYKVNGQIGRERTPDEYVSHLVSVMRECWRVLKSNGVLWLVIGDTFAHDSKWGGASGNKNYTSAAGGISRERKATGLKDKDLIGIPWMVAFAMRADGWYLRQEVIWDKPNAKPESVTDRPTTSHEHVFLFSKRPRYYFDRQAISEPAKTWYGRAATFERSGAVSEHVLPGQSSAEHRPNRNGKNSLRSVGMDRVQETGKANRAGRDMSQVGVGPTRNKRSVWSVATVPYRKAHFATFAPALIDPMVLASTQPGDIVLDPFSGTAVVGQVAEKHGRRFIGGELQFDYIALAVLRSTQNNKP